MPMKIFREKTLIKFSQDIFAKMATKEKKIKCDQCDKAYSNKWSLEAHISAIHLKIKFPCDICEESFKYEGDLKKHRFAIHKRFKKKSHKCDQCDRAFANRGALSAHVSAIHLKVKIKHQCEICGKGFQKINTLENHVSEFHLKTKLSCETCGKEFSCKYSLESHVLNVHEKTKYICHMCWRRPFLSKSDYNLHVSKPHPYMCNMCAKAFTTSSTLTLHVNRDHQKNYPCNLCGKVLGFASLLKKHMKIHHKSVKNKKPKVNEQTQETFELKNESRQKEKLKKEVKDEPLELVIENVFTLNQNVENETIIEKAHEENSKSKKPKVKEQMTETFKRCKEEPKKEVKNDPLELDIENVFPINENDEKETEESPIVFKKSKNEGEYVIEEYVMDEKEEVLVKIDEMIDLTTLDDTMENENTDEVIDLTASDEDEEL